MPENQEIQTQVTQPTREPEMVELRGTNEVVFDVNNLPPEFARYVDQERTKASRTARANAKKELMKDQDFIDSIRNQVTPEIQHTVEQTNADNIKALTRRLAKSEVTNVLSRAGMSDSEIDGMADMFIGDDIEDSVTKANAFVSLFNQSVQSRLDKQQQQAVTHMTVPGVPSPEVNETARLQAELDEARKDTSYRKAIRISAIMREASEKGITLK